MHHRACAIEFAHHRGRPGIRALFVRPLERRTDQVTQGIELRSQVRLVEIPTGYVAHGVCLNPPRTRSPSSFRHGGSLRNRSYKRREGRAKLREHLCAVAKWARIHARFNRGRQVRTDDGHPGTRLENRGDLLAR